MTKELIVVTGASSGIGEAIAKTFSELGHPLLLIARRVERLEALKLPNSLSEKVDVTDKAAFEAAVAKAEEKFGPVGALVNNAGVFAPGRVEEQDASDWKRMFDVNVTGLLNGMQAVLVRMKERNSGTIINISSVAARTVFPNMAVYAGSKFAVRAITEGVRQEVASTNVRVTTISPGAVETEIFEHNSDEQFKEQLDQWRTFTGGFLKGEDVARAAVYIYEQPQEVCIRDITLAPTKQG